MNKFIDELIDRYPKLESIKKDIEVAYELIKNMYKDGGKLLVGGNGGSAADSEHIVGELMKGFCKKRKISTDLAEKLENINKDLGLELGKCLQGALKAIFAQQVYGYGDNKDILLCISTSGNSKNLIYAAITAKAKGMKVITLTGKDGGKLKEYSDISIIVPENETFKIQELHLPIYHALCLELEEFFFE